VCAALAWTWQPRCFRAEEGREADFDSWASSCGGGEFEEVPCRELAARSEAFQTESRRFMFDTLLGRGRMEQVRMWRGPATPPPGLGQSDVAGKTELHFLVQLGNEMCGHPEYIHGGFLSSLFDELFGWNTILEFDMFDETHGAKTKIFTANLDVNYRRPVPKGSTYLCKVWVEQIVRDKKVYLRGVLLNRRGEVLTESTSLYILKRL